MISWSGLSRATLNALWWRKPQQLRSTRRTGAGDHVAPGLRRHACICGSSIFRKCAAMLASMSGNWCASGEWSRIFGPCSVSSASANQHARRVFAKSGINGRRGAAIFFSTPRIRRWSGGVEKDAVRHVGRSGISGIRSGRGSLAVRCRAAKRPDDLMRQLCVLPEPALAKPTRMCAGQAPAPETRRCPRGIG